MPATTPPSIRRAPAGPPPRRLARRAAVLAAPALLGACGGAQSALDPRARQAAETAGLFEWMAIGAAAIWATVMLIAVLAVLRPPVRGGARQADRLIVFGGVVFPTVVLAGLLTAGLRLLPDWSDSPARLQVEVTGEQFWWRVAYRRDDLPAPVRSANEIHLPAGEPVEFVLGARDVIHSFWIPSLAGKVDMVPGRETRLLVEDPQPGVYRGVCAEFCGTGHAQMAMQVVVHPPEAFERWLARRTRPAAAAASGAPAATPSAGPAAPAAGPPAAADADADPSSAAPAADPGAPTATPSAGPDAPAADPSPTAEADRPDPDAPASEAWTEAPVPGLFARALHRGREASEARGDPSEGRALFLDSGCGACHRVAGVVEAGEVGPDLTHFASRRSLAAGVAELSRPLLIDWLRDPTALKAGARMPAYGEALDEAELAALADWLLELR